jgi:lipopolysaccharide transport system ATP-binding protein
MSVVIDVKNVSKKYLICHTQQSAYSTLVETLSRKAKVLISRMAHPFDKKRQYTPDTFEDFWALKNIDMTVNEGDRVAIIGKNGSGKSTLLKLLSRITEPTEGQIRIRGRISSLLEVGTGFHPELSGRENIFLNGAILGMRRDEIRKNFDEIVAFAEVEKFLDTPVKRYSSGMYTRLGFAIAAHLDPDLLIIDEVLSVGDAPFQKKCIAKLSELGASGRTVLFVSHDVGAISSLCNKGFYLENGKLKVSGSIETCVNEYNKQEFMVSASDG